VLQTWGAIGKQVSNRSLLHYDEVSYTETDASLYWVGYGRITAPETMCEHFNSLDRKTKTNCIVMP
jgi:hypothetical protein